jgi:hypothetical protein
MNLRKWFKKVRDEEGTALSEDGIKEGFRLCVEDGEFVLRIMHQNEEIVVKINRVIASLRGDCNRLPCVVFALEDLVELCEETIQMRVANSDTLPNIKHEYCSVVIGGTLGGSKDVQP